MQGVRVVKAFSKEREEVGRFNAKSEKYAKILNTTNKLDTSLFPPIFFILRAAYYATWLIGGWFVIKQTDGFTYGVLMSFFVYLGYLLEPVAWLQNMVKRWAWTTNAIQRLFEIMDARPDVVDPENPVKIKSATGAVEFRDVEFSYEKNRKIIKGVSFQIDGGGSIGIVGHTGAGKSTLANLLTRLYDVESGAIFIDGVNIKDLAFDDFRGMISIVSQETYLFSGTIAENIRYAKQDATNEELIAAAKIAAAHDFIMKLPDGYQTKIGRGHKEDLSGGERQRISIARAVLMNPRILIMDEATAAMDTETERNIQNALARLVKGRTTIIIAHRLSTLRDVDKLVVIQTHNQIYKS
ncbi:hypothetical protein FACS1894219_12860 [Clostridia bacterium]|nr:hypothetical protein FACS1894219_12860 [Clostridia bacterium]